MACMTRDEMAAVIRSGQTVIHNGRLIATEAQIPSESELAAGDPAKVKAAKEVLEARKKAIDLELEALDKPAATEPEKPKVPTEADLPPVFKVDDPKAPIKGK